MQNYVSFAYTNKFGVNEPGQFFVRTPDIKTFRQKDIKTKDTN